MIPSALSRDEKIRIKAAELSFNLCGQITSGALTNPHVTSIVEMSPFYLCKDIENYIRVGEIPAPIVPEKK